MIKLKKLLSIVLLFGFMGLTLVNCRETEEKKDDIEEVGEEIEDAADDAADEVEDAVDD